MADPRTGNIERQDSESEHIGPLETGDNISAKRSAVYAYDVASGQWRRINSKLLGTQLTTDDSGIVTNTIIHGKTTAGGGSYVDVKVNPSGAMVVENTPVSSSTNSQASVSVTNTNTSVLGSNANRLGATIWNEGTAICYLKLGGTASTTSYSLQIAVGGYYEVPFNYTGPIDGITSSGTAQLRITELT